MTTFLNFITITLGIFGSLTLFLFGMKVMSDGLQKAAGNKLQNTLNLMTKNRFVGLLSGAAITALIQSSSATTVLVVSFANAGLITVVQSISVIMGANIGTTVTAWLVTISSVVAKVDITAISIIILAFMLPLLFSKQKKLSSIAEAMIGFTILFIGLDFISKAVVDVKNSPAVEHFLVTFGAGNFRWYQMLLFVLLGCALTALVQSSSAVTAIGITLVGQGILPLNPVAALVIGSNIGTTITAFLASLGANTNAKRASVAHFLFNFFGAIWTIIIFAPFVKLIEICSAPLISLLNATDPTVAATIQVAVFHTLFNLINSLLLIWFVPQFAKVVEKIVPNKKGDELDERYTLKYISASLQDTPELNIQNAKIELKKMTSITIDMFNTFIEIFSNPDKKMGSVLEHLKKQEDYTDQMQEGISLFLQNCSQESLAYNTRLNVNAMIKISQDLENIGDSCFNLGLVTQKKYESQIAFCEEALSELNPFIELTKEFLNFIFVNMNKKLSPADLDKAFHLEKSVDEMRSDLRKKSRRRIQAGGDVKAELLYLDIVKHIEHIGDAALNVAQDLSSLR